MTNNFRHGNVYPERTTAFTERKRQSLTAVIKSEDGSVLSSGSLRGNTSPTPLWADPKTKINFRLVSAPNKETLIRMAESVTRK